MPNKRTSILNEERRRAIVDFVNRNGRALVRDLAKTYDSSEITIRRDLELLHNRGLIYRTHGGALPIRAGAESDRNLTEREMQHPREKQLIAAAAAKMVKEGQSVVLDSGSTTTAIARALREFQHLTVITNAINIASELSGTAIDIILTGGMLRPNSYSLVGPIAEESLRRLKADILFLGVDGFDTQTGVSTPNLLEAQLNRLMVQIATRVIAVCDSSKFGRSSLSSIVPLSNLHGVITDKQIPRQHLRALKKAGIETILV
ncbi:MAG TPA: transcriptional repressor AgaR [Candidatus Eisenbacteria bacterium]|nr:transcriptional repressor AgaR [Candidatus Eisenbacteria bacterium]